MPVGDYCTRSVQTTTASATLRAAAEHMEREGVGCLVVITNQQVTGLVTDRDVALRVVREELDPETSIVGQLMERVPIVIHEDSPLRVAAGLMRRHGLRRLPVVDEDDHLKGVISSDDLLRLLGRELSCLGDALAAQAPGGGVYSTGDVAQTLPEVE